MITCTIRRERPNRNGNTLAVALVPIPNAPPFFDENGDRVIPAGREMLTVIAASDNEVEDGKEWGWVHLDHEEKQVIGAALKDRFGAVAGQWYWCELWYTKIERTTPRRHG